MAIIGRRTLNDICIYQVNSDPRISIDENCVAGSIALWNDNGSGFSFLKTASGNLAWENLSNATPNDSVSTYLTTPLVDISNTAITVPYNVVRQNTNGAIFNPDILTGEVEVLLANGYQITCDIGVTKTSGNNNVSIDVWIEINNVEIVASRAHVNVAGNANSNSLTVSMLPVMMAANDVVRIRTQKVVGSQNASLNIDACRFIVTKV